MTRWDVLTVLGGIMLAGGAWWIYPPAAMIVLGVEAVLLGIKMDQSQGQNQNQNRRG